MYKTQKIGKFGEEEARKYLKKEGYKILDRNFSCKMGEIDIIALKNNEIIFIEIKTRTNNNYGLPSEAVSKSKLRHIYKTAEYYLYIKNLQKQNVRIDVIEIYIINKKIEINHLKQII